MTQQIQSVDTLDDLLKLLEDNKAVVVKYHAQWCGPCKMFAPTFTRFARQYGGDITFVEMDVGNLSPTDSNALGVRSVPHFQIWFEETKVGEVTGAVAKKVEDLIEKLEDML